MHAGSDSTRIRCSSNAHAAYTIDRLASPPALNPHSLMSQDVTDNSALSRFELALPGGVTFADYERRDGRVIITHVETPPVLRGQGAAGQLMQGIVDWAGTHQAHLTPICSYAVAWFDKHPQHKDLLA